MNYDKVIQQNTDQSLKKNGESVFIHSYRNILKICVKYNISVHVCKWVSFLLPALPLSLSETRSHYVALVSQELAT